MSQPPTTWIHYQDHDEEQHGPGLWVGPGPHPMTRRRKLATQFANGFGGPRHKRIQEFARFLYEPRGPGAWKRAQVERELRGHLLLTSDPAHGRTLAWVAEGRPLEQLLDQLAGVAPEPLTGAQVELWRTR